MAESTREGMDMFEMYNRTYKNWMDIWSSYSRMPGGFQNPFTMPGMMPGMQDWTKMFRGFGDVSKDFPFPAQFTKDINEAVTRGMNTCMRLHNEWLKAANRITCEAVEMSRKIGAGEEIDTTKYLEEIKTAVEEIDSTIMDELKGTPFAGLSNIEAVIKEALSSNLPEEQKKANELLQKLANYNLKVMNKSLSAMKDAGKSAAHLIEKGTLKSDGIEEAMKSYEDLFKESMAIFQAYDALPQKSRVNIDDATRWNRSYLDLFFKWSEINLGVYRAISSSGSEIYKTVNEQLKDKKITSLDQMYKIWMEVNQKSTDILMKQSQYFENVSDFAKSYGEWVRATSTIYRDIAPTSSIFKEDAERTAEESQPPRASSRNTAEEPPKAQESPRKKSSSSKSESVAG